MERGEAVGLPSFLLGGARHKTRSLCHIPRAEITDCGLFGLDVEAVASLDLRVLLLHGEMKLVIAGGSVILAGGIAEDILVVEFLVEVGINFVESLFLGDLKESPAGCLSHLFENFLAVGT